MENADEFKDFRKIPKRKQKPLVRMTHSGSFKHHYRLLVRRVRELRNERRGNEETGKLFVSSSFYDGNFTWTLAVGDCKSFILLHSRVRARSNKF